MIDLKPCPFCGSDDVAQQFGIGGEPYVSCIDCGANVDGKAGTWNTRATPDILSDPRVKALVEQVRALLVAADGESYAAYNAALEATDAALRAIGGDA